MKIAYYLKQFNYISNSLAAFLFNIHVFNQKYVQTLTIITGIYHRASHVASYSPFFFLSFPCKFFVRSTFIFFVSCSFYFSFYINRSFFSVVVVFVYIFLFFFFAILLSTPCLYMFCFHYLSSVVNLTIGEEPIVARPHSFLE